MAKISNFMVLFLVAIGATAAPAAAESPRRALRQVATSTPVSIPGNPQQAAQAQPWQAVPPVQAQSLGAALIAKEVLAAKSAPSAPAAAAPAVVVLPAPAPQVASLPTTLGGPLQITTSTPGRITVSSPINVSTPVKQVNAQFAHGKGGGKGDLLPSPNDIVTVIAGVVAVVANALGAAAAVLPPLTAPLPLLVGR